MQRIAWATDLHLNFVALPAWDSFVVEVRESRADALLVTGDISEAEDLGWSLQRLREHLQLPVFFVLGNHDFYRSSIAALRNSLTAQTQRTTEAADRQAADPFYLTDAAPLQLHDRWVLCGDDGWADARAGDYFGSPIRMNDFRLIDDLADLDPTTRLRRLRREGAAAAQRLGRQLRAAAELGNKILVATHIPPFRESCWYEGHHTDDAWAPFFVCHATGWQLRRFCRAHPAHEVLVLCGHTHHAGRSRIAENLRVWTGGAEYGHPRLCGLLDLTELTEAALASSTVDWDGLA